MKAYSRKVFSFFTFKFCGLQCGLQVPEYQIPSKALSSSRSSTNFCQTSKRSYPNNFWHNSDADVFVSRGSFFARKFRYCIQFQFYYWRRTTFTIFFGHYWPPSSNIKMYEVATPSNRKYSFGDYLSQRKPTAGLRKT